jgi:DNA-binding transcriptional MerR regulator
MSSDGPSPGAVWTAGQVARHLGIAESTLRSWHRRYRIGPDNARAGTYRRYATDDVTRLRRMRDLVRSGMLPSDAARDVVRRSGTGTVRAPAEDVSAVLAAARRLDTQACVAVLRRSLDQRGVQRMWDQVCRPALSAVTNDMPDDPESVCNEHVLSWAVSSVLQRVERPDTAPDVLLACTESETHTLPLEALAAALGELGTAVRMIGAATPTASLLHAVETSRPDAVVLWSQQRSTARPEALASLLATDTPRPVIAGPGWATPVPAGVLHCTSLTDAVTLLTKDT